MAMEKIAKYSDLPPSYASSSQRVDELEGPLFFAYCKYAYEYHYACVAIFANRSVAEEWFQLMKRHVDPEATQSSAQIFNFKRTRFLSEGYVQNIHLFRHLQTKWVSIEHMARGMIIPSPNGPHTGPGGYPDQTAEMNRLQGLVEQQRLELDRLHRVVDQQTAQMSALTEKLGQLVDILTPKTGG